MRPTRRHRHAAPALAAAVACLTVVIHQSNSLAITSTWDGASGNTAGTSGSGSAWLTATNWGAGGGETVPGAQGTGSTNSDVAVFQANGTSSSVGINMNTATNNTFTLGEILLTGGTLSRSIGNSSTAANGTLRLTSSAGVILSNTSTNLSLTLQDTQGSGTRTMDLVFVNGGDINVTNTAASITLASTITSASTLGFRKTGSGTLVLSATNAYTGSTTLAGGVTAINNGANLGATPASPKADSVIFDGGTLRWTGTNASSSFNANRGLTLNAAGGTLDVLNSGVNWTVSGAVAGSGTLTKTGAGDLTLAGSSSFTGGVVVNQGGLFISQGSNLGATPASPVTNLTLNNGSTLHVTSSFSLNGNRRIALGAGAQAIDVAGTSFTVLGSITGSGSLLKMGTGTLVLNGPSTSYSGGTEVATGTLVVNNSLSGHATGTGLTTVDALSILTTTSGATIASVSVLAGGTITAAPAQVLVIDGNATIAGTASGNLQVTGNAAVTGTLSPGNSPGTFSVGGSLSLAGDTDLELAGTSAAEYDQVLVTGALAFGGDLNVTLINSFAPAAGDSFDLFDFATASGTFAQVNLPMLAPSLVWDTSSLYTTGEISVARAVPLPATVWTGAAALGLLASAQYLVRRRQSRP